MGEVVLEECIPNVSNVYKHCRMESFLEHEFCNCWRKGCRGSSQ